MPYTAANAKDHAKGLSPKQATLWAKIANSTMTTCMAANGGTDATCSAKALKAAGAMAGKMGEAESAERQLYAALTEKGRVLSADNEKAIRTALASIQAVLAKVMVDDAAVTEAALNELPDLAVALTEAELSFSDRERAIRAALKVRNPLGYCWLRDVYDADCIFEMEAGGGYDGTGHLYRVTYTIGADGAAMLGDPAEVRVETSYVPVGGLATTEANRELTGDLVPLVEKAIRRDGTVPVKLIQPGQGSSGFYSADVLKRDGPKVFTKGTHMYADHATPAEEAERPEGSIRNLMATLDTDARWEDQGTDGPGLYADARVMPHFAEHLEALAPHIGVSIRAFGTYEEGGQSVKELVAAKSVDFVTRAGAGGKVLEMFEAARNGRVPTTTPKGGPEVDENEARTLREAASNAQTKLSEAEAKLARLDEMTTELARMKEGLLLRDARSFVASELAGIQLPDMTRTRLAESLSANPPVKDEALDLDAYRTRIKESAAAELEYLAKVTGAGSGRITGLGGNTTSTAVTAEEADKRLDAEFKELLGESAGAAAARGRVN